MSAREEWRQAHREQRLQSRQEEYEFDYRLRTGRAPYSGHCRALRTTCETATSGRWHAVRCLPTPGAEPHPRCHGMYRRVWADDLNGTAWPFWVETRAPSVGRCV